MVCKHLVCFPFSLHSVCLQAITTPAMAVSHIMLEAYKKYILVSLILHGKVQQLPKYTSQIVGRFIKVSAWTPWFGSTVKTRELIMFSVCVCDVKPLSNAYHELAQVYASNNPSELRAVVSRHGETFTRDNNSGLVKQCLSSLYKKNIQRLTKVWTTLMTCSACVTVTRAVNRLTTSI